jgi:hypothetical protein
MAFTKQRGAARPPRKIYTGLDEAELRAVDKFGFRNQIRDRSQAIRRLIKIAVVASRRKEVGGRSA